MPPLNNEQITALKKKATLASVSLAITLSLLKTFGALYTGSLSVLTSMIDSLADIFASSVTYIAVKVSSKPASRNHRYGYGKAEALSALIQSAFVAGSGIFVLYTRHGFLRLNGVLKIATNGRNFLCGEQSKVVSVYRNITLLSL